MHAALWLGLREMNHILWSLDLKSVIYQLHLKPQLGEGHLCQAGGELGLALMPLQTQMGRGEGLCLSPFPSSPPLSLPYPLPSLFSPIPLLRPFQYPTGLGAEIQPLYPVQRQKLYHLPAEESNLESRVGEAGDSRGLGRMVYASEQPSESEYLSLTMSCSGCGTTLLTWISSFCDRCFLSFL